jgi:hypothetical protein
MASLGLRRLLVLSGLGCASMSWVIACNSREYAITPGAEPEGGQTSTGSSGGTSPVGGRTASGGTVGKHNSSSSEITSGGADETGGTSSSETSGGAGGIGGESSGGFTSGGTSGLGGTSNGGTSNGGTNSGGTSTTGGTSATGGTSGGATSCTLDQDCASNPVKNICDVPHKTCVECIPGETACGSGLFCSSDYTCRVGCSANTDCPTGSCDITQNRCIGCTTTADCGSSSATVECDIANKICIEKGCKSTPGCRTGFTCSSGYCKNLTTDKYNCGTPGNVCSSANGTASCSTGKCSIVCKSGYGDCHTDTNDGCESNLATDANHCNSCTKVCTTGQVCHASACLVPTPCTDYCTSPTVFAIPPTNGITLNDGIFTTDPSFNTKICFESYDATKGFIDGACANFTPGHTLYINGVTVPCDGVTWSWYSAANLTGIVKPTPAFGGYCYYDDGKASNGSPYITLW